MSSRISFSSTVLASACAVLLLCSSVNAALTYVDADFSTNTGPGSAFAGAVTSPDNLWGQRGFGTNGTVLESSGTGSGTEDSPEISTTIGGLTAGAMYDVYAHFYDVSTGSGENWPIRAGFTSGSLTLFANGNDGGDAALSASPAGLASNLSFVTDPLFDDGGNRLLYAAPLGTTAASGSGDIIVYIDDLPSTIGANNRTWYDGISYEFVPEPTSAMLLLLACLAFAPPQRNSSRDR